MSALTDLFTAMANKIRSKTGTATTYTPLEMVSDGIDDVYAAGYDAGGGGATGTPITPSNSSPASMTSGTTYEAQANGYAIASYSSATPSNENPFFMQEDEYYKLSPGWAGGYLIGTYDQITPSNSSPVSLSSGAIYKMGGAGKAVASVTDITPSDSTPAALSSGTVYKAGGAGYAIDSYTSISSSQLTDGVYFSSGFKKMASSGYAYSSQRSKASFGTFTRSTSTVTVNCGFQPQFIGILFNGKSGSTTTIANGATWRIYDSSYSTSYWYDAYKDGGSANMRKVDIGTTYGQITSTGFTFNGTSSSNFQGTYYYFAIG